MKKDFEIEVLGLGIGTKRYPGAFTGPVKKVILSLIESPSLNLFSGISTIGDVRIDNNPALEEPTLKMDVFDFISVPAYTPWEWVILDPPYAQSTVGSGRYEKKYPDEIAISHSVPKRRALVAYFQKYARNVLWLDICAPLPKGFKRKKLWLFLPGGFRTTRVLSQLENTLI